MTGQQATDSFSIDQRMQSGSLHIEKFYLPGQSKACLGSALTHRARYNAETQSVVDRGRDPRLVPTTHCGCLTVSSYEISHYELHPKLTLYILQRKTVIKRRGSVVVSTSALRVRVTPGPGIIHQVYKPGFQRC